MAGHRRVPAPLSSTILFNLLGLQRSVSAHEITRRLDDILGAAENPEARKNHQKSLYTTMWKLTRNGYVEQIREINPETGEVFETGGPGHPNKYVITDAGIEEAKKSAKQLRDILALFDVGIKKLESKNDSTK